MALSTLYLDTELHDGELKAIAKTLHDSGYDFETIRNIDIYEVFPVVVQNALSITGVWSGFDEDWLMEAITTRLKNRSYFQKKLLEFKYQCLRWRFKSDWKYIEREFKAMKD